MRQSPSDIFAMLESHSLWLRQDLRGFRINLSLCNLTGMDFSHADLRRARLVGASFKHGSLAGAILQEADLFGADLDNANLTMADLAGAILRGARLVGAEMPGARIAEKRVDERAALVASSLLVVW